MCVCVCVLQEHFDKTKYIPLREDAISGLGVESGTPVYHIYCNSFTDQPDSVKPNRATSSSRPTDIVESSSQRCRSDPRSGMVFLVQNRHQGPCISSHGYSESVLQV